MSQTLSRQMKVEDLDTSGELLGDGDEARGGGVEAGDGQGGRGGGGGNGGSKSLDGSDERGDGGPDGGGLGSRGSGDVGSEGSSSNGQGGADVADEDDDLLDGIGQLVCLLLGEADDTGSNTASGTRGDGNDLSSGGGDGVDNSLVVAADGGSCGDHGSDAVGVLDLDNGGL